MISFRSAALLCTYTLSMFPSNDPGYVQPAEPELLRAAAEAHVQEPPADPGRAEQERMSRRAQQRPLAGREVEGEKPASARYREVVDNDVSGQRGPPEPPAPP